MRPQRIVVGEVRQQECLDLLIALNSGTPGMCTVHANSAREAITKMCTLPLPAFTEVCLSNALRLETYIWDAEWAGDDELADFFRRRRRAEKERSGRRSCLPPGLSAGG